MNAVFLAANGENATALSWIALWIGINSLVGYAIGKPKNEIRGSIILSLLLGPIGWLLAIFNKGNVRACPFCAENIKIEARVCRYCGRDVPDRIVSKVIAPPMRAD